MTTTDKLQAAIERSASRNEIVHLQLADLGDTQDAVLCLLADLAGDLDSDYAVNGSVVECWASRPDDDAGTEWRLHIHR